LKAKVHTLSSDKISQIIGIASHLSDYKLSWLFNEQLNFKFQQSDDINIDNPKSANPDKLHVNFQPGRNVHFNKIA